MHKLIEMRSYEMPKRETNRKMIHRMNVYIFRVERNGINSDGVNVKILIRSCKSTVGVTVDNFHTRNHHRLQQQQ